MNIDLNTHLLKLLEDNNLLDKRGEIDIQDVNHLLSLISKKMDERDIDYEKFKAILDVNPCTISWVKRDLTYTGVNKTLASICNVPAEEFVGQTIGFYTKNKYFYNFTKLLFRSKKTTLYEELESDLQGIETKFWTSGTKFDEDRQAVIIGIDITEMKKMEDHITFTDKLSALGEMVAGIIHEVNNPLTVIDGKAMKTIKKLEGGEVQDLKDDIIDSMSKIRNTVQKINKIIRGVKSFVRHGNEDPFVETDIYPIIEDAYAIVQGKFKGSGIQVKMAAKEEDLIVKCNITHIFQVFVNLMTNAIDAIDSLENVQDKWVSIEFRNQPESLQVRFTDCGSGIPEDVQKEMFKSFYTTKELGKGTGLGLSLCFRIMEDHGGHITVDNDSPNTCFVVTFPKGNKSQAP